MQVRQLSDLLHAFVAVVVETIENASRLFVVADHTNKKAKSPSKLVTEVVPAKSERSSAIGDDGMVKLTADQLASISKRLSDPKEVARLNILAKQRFDARNNIDPSSPTELDDFGLRKTSHRS